MRRSTYKFENRENLEILQKHVQLIQNWAAICWCGNLSSFGITGVVKAKAAFMSGLGSVNE